MAQMFEHGGLGEGDMFADMANTFLFDENDEGPMPLQLQVWGPFPFQNLLCLSTRLLLSLLKLQTLAEIIESGGRQAAELRPTAAGVFLPNCVQFSKKKFPSQFVTRALVMFLFVPVTSHAGGLQPAEPADKHGNGDAAGDGRGVWRQ